MYNIVDEKPFINAKLISWYRKHKRDLPWRNMQNAYHIWLSEIILQQTRVAQGTAYYYKFIDHYPTIKDLAEASEENILKDWQGLGYYSRARNLHAAAKTIMHEHHGQFPETYKAIRALKGIGDYTAAAIASFAFDLPHAVLDGNVFRFLSRYFGIEIPIDSSQGKKTFQNIAQELLDTEKPAEFNQAIMEFGALQCTPKKVDCTNCPFQVKCYAFNNQSVDQFPVKKNKTKQRNRYFQYFIIESDQKLLVKKRNSKGIWQNLFDFPLIEVDTTRDLKTTLKSEDFKNLIKGKDFTIEASSKEYKHILSHQIIYAHFHHLKVPNFAGLDLSTYTAIDNRNLIEYPIPKLIENYLKEETNLLSLLDK